MRRDRLSWKFVMSMKEWVVFSKKTFKESYFKNSIMCPCHHILCLSNSVTTLFINFRWENGRRRERIQQWSDRGERRAHDQGIVPYKIYHPWYTVDEWNVHLIMRVAAVYTAMNWTVCWLYMFSVYMDNFILILVQ